MLGATQASFGVQRCVCLQRGHLTGIAASGKVSNLTVSVSSPVKIGWAVIMQRVNISAIQIIRAAPDLC